MISEEIKKIGYNGYKVTSTDYQRVRCNYRRNEI